MCSGQEPEASLEPLYNCLNPGIRVPTSLPECFQPYAHKLPSLELPSVHRMGPVQSLVIRPQFYQV